MRFTFPTATIASLSGVTFLTRTSSSGVAASVSLAYKRTGSVRAAAKSQQGAECSFSNGIQVDSSPDTGILSCGRGETCVEDTTSAAGGRCVRQEGVAVESHRHLAEACTYSDGTSGTKCVGTNACTGLDTANVGCGSCIGTDACSGFYGTGSLTIGEGSCIGDKSCNKIYSKDIGPVVIGDGSCLNNGGADACYNTYAEYDGGITIGDGSCHDNVGCKFLQGKSWVDLLLEGVFPIYH